MTGILVFESRHGQIAVEVDESVARAAGGTADPSGFSPKSRQSVGADVLAKAPKTFSDAMESLKAYAGALEDVIMGLDLAPSEVAVEIGLKLTGSAGFIIAKAGAESEMKVSLKWEPRSARQTAS